MTVISSPKSERLVAVSSEKFYASKILDPKWQLFTGALFIAFAPILVKATTLGPNYIAFFRCAIAVIIFLPMLFLWRERLRHAPVHWLKFFLLSALAGSLFAADLAVWHRSVLDAGAGMATILANTQVLYLALAGVFWFREPLRKRFILALILGVVGMTMLVAMYAPEYIGPHYLRGIFFGVLTGMVYASFLLALRAAEMAGPGLPMGFKILVISLVCSLWLGALSYTQGEWEWPTMQDWLVVSALALVGQIAGWQLIARNIGRVPIGEAGLIMLAQPVFATLLGALIYLEKMTLWQGLGAALTLAGIYLGATRQLERPEPRNT